MWTILLLAFAQGPAAQQASALVDASVAFANRGEFREAAERLVQALALDPNQGEAHYLLGLVRQSEGRREAARESFARAVKLAPRNGAAQARLCELDTEFAMAPESGYEAAMGVCRRAAQLEPGDGEVRYHLGRSQAKRGEQAAAIASFQTALRLDPKLAGARFALGLAYLDSQNLTAAIPMFEQVVKAEPANGNAHFQLGAALAKQGDCGRALPHLEAATTSAQKHYVLAGCLVKLNRPEEAARERERVRELRAGDEARKQGRFRAALAQKMAAAGELDGAETEYRAALEMAPDLTLKIDLAVVLLRKGKAAEVGAVLGGEADPLARYQVALAEAKLGRVGAARGILEEVLRGRPGFAEAWYQLGVWLLEEGEVVGAERALGTAVGLRPDEPAMRLAWAAALERAGRGKEGAAQRRLAGSAN
jgi:tetratricopeptide (TPR) repeat protein